MIFKTAVGLGGPVALGEVNLFPLKIGLSTTSSPYSSFFSCDVLRQIMDGLVPSLGDRSGTVVASQVGCPLIAYSGEFPDQDQRCGMIRGRRGADLRRVSDGSTSRYLQSGIPSTSKAVWTVGTSPACSRSPARKCRTAGSPPPGAVSPPVRIPLDECEPVHPHHRGQSSTRDPVTMTRPTEKELWPDHRPRLRQRD